jgi:CRP/FNR family transcriptional regulator, transcriptional activator FtrB
MAEAEFDRLMQASFLQRFPAHVVLINEGESADFLHVVVEGLVELFSRHQDRETTIGFASPVSTFILAAAVTDKVYLKSARTTVASQILMIPAEAIRAAFASDVAFARAVVSELAERYREIVRELKDQKLRTSLERLAAWILRQAGPGDGDLTVTIPHDKGALASRLGMSRENLSRNFAGLEAYGVTVSGRHITCRDRKALESLAHLDPLIDNAGA